MKYAEFVWYLATETDHGQQVFPQLGQFQSRESPPLGQRGAETAEDTRRSGERRGEAEAQYLTLGLVEGVCGGWRLLGFPVQTRPGGRR